MSQITVRQSNFDLLDKGNDGNSIDESSSSEDGDEEDEDSIEEQAAVRKNKTAAYMVGR